MNNPFRHMDYILTRWFLKFLYTGVGTYRLSDKMTVLKPVFLAKKRNGSFILFIHNPYIGNILLITCLQ